MKVHRHKGSYTSHLSDKVSERKVLSLVKAGEKAHFVTMQVILPVQHKTGISEARQIGILKEQENYFHTRKSA